MHTTPSPTHFHALPQSIPRVNPTTHCPTLDPLQHTIQSTCIPTDQPDLSLLPQLFPLQPTPACAPQHSPHHHCSIPLKHSWPLHLETICTLMYRDNPSPKYFPPHPRSLPIHTWPRPSSPQPLPIFKPGSAHFPPQPWPSPF